MQNLRIAEIASRCGVTKPVVLRWIRAGDLAAVNVSSGGRAPRYRVSPDALAAFLVRRSTATGSESNDPR